MLSAAACTFPSSQAALHLSFVSLSEVETCHRNNTSGLCCRSYEKAISYNIWDVTTKNAPKLQISSFNLHEKSISLESCLHFDCIRGRLYGEKSTSAVVVVEDGGRSGAFSFVGCTRSFSPTKQETLQKLDVSENTNTHYYTLHSPIMTRLWF